MTTELVAIVISIVLAALVGWVVPAWAIRRLLPALEASGHLVTNYRGRRIPTGLGLVWLVWATGVWLAATIVSIAAMWVAARASAGVLPRSLVDAVASVSVPFATLPVMLVMGAAFFGLVDDLFGDSSAKGFRGHLTALAKGGLTTGGLKLLGIGVLALATSASIGQRAVSGVASAGGLSTLAALAGWAVSALVIALSANLVNLTDLRPGRALKTYSVLATIGLLVTLLSQLIFAGALSTPWSAAYLWQQTVQVGGLKLTLIALVFGPVLAVWRLDLGERAMLGDAGANAMGAFAGYLLVASAPLWLASVFAVVLLALNLASEKFSFTRVIEKVGFLRWFDGLGRLPLEPEAGTDMLGDDGTRAGGPAAEGDNAQKGWRGSQQ